MARGTTVPLRRGTEATWQDACGPHGARVARTCGRVPRGEGVGKWRAHGLVGPG